MNDPTLAPVGNSPRCDFVVLSGNQLAGHVFDPDDLDRRFVVELLLDFQPVALARADLYEPDLVAAGYGDGCYGFAFTLDPAALQAARRADLRLANSSVVLCPPVRLPALQQAETGRRGGHVRWEGGVRLTGWFDAAASENVRARAWIDGRMVAETGPTRWTQAGDGAEARAARGFDLFLPRAFADGCARQARVTDENGRELPGSPCEFVAFADGLADFLAAHAEVESEILRGAFYDRVTPQGLPFDQCADWRAAFPPPEPAAVEAPVGVVLVGEAGALESLESLREQIHCAFAAVSPAGEPFRFDARELLAFLDGDGRDCGVVVFAPAGARFESAALASLAGALAEHPESPLAYADFILTASDGGEWPVAFSAFDYELMLEQGGGALFFAARSEYLRAALAEGVDNLFRLFNFCGDRRPTRGPRRPAPGAGLPVHLPLFLAHLPRIDLAAGGRKLVEAVTAHLARRGVKARCEPAFGAVLPAARVTRGVSKAKVSILIPTRDRVELLRTCIESLFATVDVTAHEIIVLDNESADAETHAYFTEIGKRGVRVRKVGGAFNFARIVNSGAAVATGDLILLLNNDVEAKRPGWLEEMIGRMAEPDVGAVGAALLWPSGVVQHGGVVLGPNFDACHAFNDRIDSDPGYLDLLRAAHEVSAVTAACLLTDRRLYHEVGGFDGAHFPVNYNDVDFCLKLRARGFRIVQTPHARLLHYESASRGLDKRADQRQRFQRERRNLRAAWGAVLAADPAYNPQLSLDPTPFSALAWPPRPRRARLPFIAPPRIIPPGF